MGSIFNFCIICFISTNSIISAEKSGLGREQRDWQLPRPTSAQAQESKDQFPKTLN